MADDRRATRWLAVLIIGLYLLAWMAHFAVPGRFDPTPLTPLALLAAGYLFGTGVLKNGRNAD